MDSDSALSVHNLPFLESLLEAHRRDPGSIDPQWLPLIEGDGEPLAPRHVPRTSAPTRGPSSPPPGRTANAAELEQLALQTRVDAMIETYRLHGHLGAKLDPLGGERQFDAVNLDPAHFGLAEQHMDREFHSSGLFPRNATLREIFTRLRNTYCRHIGVEYWHLFDPRERAWLQQRMEATENAVVPSPDNQRRLLRSLARVESVDKFLHSKFLGAKRFSVAGGESVIALLEILIENAAEHDVGEVIFGMAHRGRLAVLMNILGKTPEEIFSEFDETDPRAFLGSGDVKYHLGYHRHHVTQTGREIYLALAFNPSHLEAITPVISGRVRARQDEQYQRGHEASLGVTIHGDAAFSGQGVVAETLNMAQLDGYDTGGVIRVVINNQIGFTTDPSDSRSGIYCTDISNIIGVPVFHVNGDDPEAAAYAAQLAVEWRQRFHKDIVIDLVCYRKFGHNEGDDPTFTQPQMYEQIKDHASVRTLYQQTLVERGTCSTDECGVMDQELMEEFNAALEAARQADPIAPFSPLHGIWKKYVGGDEVDTEDPDTSLSSARLEALRPKILATPDDFTVHRKVKRVLDEVAKMLAGEAPFNWAAGELMAYASLLTEGHRVRFSGQDARRGTFSHRHAVLTDPNTGDAHCPLQHLAPDQRRFEIYNSPLSEYSVLGFEFGYSLMAPEALVVWEAQFGDFANGAQVMIDQFISSSEDKWNRLSGLVMLLPHGYEGQGPEHSSARLERFLQMCAEDNMQVCNLTTPAQMFHVLRRQCLRAWRKPLVVMTPKSLLRFRPCFSDLEAVTNGQFQRVIDDPAVESKAVRRLLLCSGKVFYDLDAARTEREREDVAIVRVEQLYPWHRTAAALEGILERFSECQELVFVQEEPHNMGPWSFISPRLTTLGKARGLEPRYVGRERSASPATGSKEAHKLELEMILNDAFS